TGATDGTDPAAGDMFAALMAALLPQATVGDMSVAGLAGPLVATAGDTTAVATATDGQGTPAVLNLTDGATATVQGLDSAIAAITADGPKTPAATTTTNAPATDTA